MIRRFVLICLLAFSANAFALDYEGLQKLIVDGNLKTVEDVLSKLNQNDRSNFVLAFGSRSLQTSTYQEPRAILSLNEGTLLLAFNSPTSRFGSDRIEAIQFRAASSSFEFRDIRFPDSKNQLTNATFSGPNPKACMVCHHGASSPRPNWDSYPVWPGFYGSRHNAGSSEDEERNFTQFVQSAPSHPRYKYLSGLSILTHLATSNVSRSKELGTLNFLRMMSLIKKNPFYEQYKYAVAAGLNNCEDLAGFLPAKLAQFHEKRAAPMNLLIESTRKAMLEGRTADEAEFDLILNRRSMIAALRFIFEPLGEAVEDWSMSFTFGTYRFSTGSNGIEQFRTIFEESAKVDRKCDVLKPQSLKALEPVTEEILIRFGGQ
jgi:hypothetical protein